MRLIATDDFRTAIAILILGAPQKKTFSQTYILYGVNHLEDFLNPNPVWLANPNPTQG